MNDSSRHAGCFARLLLLLVAAVGMQPAAAAPANLYSTAFESTNGFNPAYDLAGQNGWTNFGYGGNGVVDYYQGYGQSAYIGFEPAAPYDGLYLWRPVNFNPTNYPIVSFGVDMAIIDSTNGYYDEFRWSVYNTGGKRLFSLGFDNGYVPAEIYYQLDDNIFYSTGWSIDTGPVYTVQMTMNFASNIWNAWVGPVQVVTNAPITTTNSQRTLREVEAVWLPKSTAGAGDNFMLFDNLSITADVLPQTIPTLQPPVFLGGGQHRVRVLGEAGKRYAIEGGTNLLNWTALRTNLMSSHGYFDFTNTAAVAPMRFYRARWLP